jgi:hypothetical protein
MNDLKEIAERVLSFLTLPHEYVSSNYPGYHGFGKVRFVDEQLREWCNGLDIDSSDYQVELVRVDGDLTQETHRHNKSTAFVVVLGPAHGFPIPENFLALLDWQWVPISAGEKIEISPGTAHGFTVKPGESGGGYFLSVQTPPIVNARGEDDYEVITL